MELVHVPIKDLKFADYNPRQISESQFKKLRKSIFEFGFVEPVVVNKHPGRENIIVGGHMRVRAAEAEGMANVPCFYINVPPFREKLINLALNRISGDWDEDKLVEVMHGLNEEAKVGNEISIGVSGFEDKELANIIEHQSLRVPKDFDREKEPKTCPHCGKEI